MERSNRSRHDTLTVRSARPISDKGGKDIPVREQDRLERDRNDTNRIDQASEESFPASEPPAFAGGV